MTKLYSIRQAAKILGISYEALRKRLLRDADLPKEQRQYPNAFKPEYAFNWVIPEKDLKKG